MDRLNKFGTLIGNEILKLRRRKTLLVMLIVLLVICLGYQFLMGPIVNSLFDYVLDGQVISLQEEARNNVDNFKERGGAEAIDPYERQMWYYYSTILNSGMESDDWRYQSGLLNQWAEAMAYQNPDADALKHLLDQNDYKAYYRYLMAENERLIMDSRLAEAKNWGYQYCLDHDIQPLVYDDWRYQKATTAAEIKYKLCGFDIRKETTGIETDPVLYEETMNAFVLAKYQLDHNIEVNPADSFEQNALVGVALGTGGSTSAFWNAIASSGNTVVGIFMIIIAGSIVAGEFQKGTIKFLLLVPAKRWKILLAKYCAVLLTGLFFLVVAWTASLTFCLLFQGAKDAFLPALFVKNGEVTTTSPYLLLFGRIMLSTVRVVVTATLAFAISSLLRNSAAAVGVSMLVLFGGNTITSILQLMRQDWARYLIFANIDLVSVQQGTTGFAHQSMLSAVIVLLLHMVVFLWTAFDSFTRREI